MLANQIDLFGKQIEQQISVNLCWTRPTSVPYPKIWKSLELKSKSGQTYKVRIEDITPDRYEEVLDFMYSNFDCQELISRSINLSSDEESIVARRAVRRKILEQKVSLVATLEDDQNNGQKPNIMGALILMVNSKNDPPQKVVGKKMTLLHNFFCDEVLEDIDDFQILNADTYFDDSGLAVAPEYYGLGLGYHLFSCILPMCKALNVPGSLNMFTSTFSQSIAEKLGFELCREISYQEYKDEHGKIIFPVEGTLKYMMLKNVE